MKQILRVLFVEDSESDADLIIRHLERGGYQVWATRVETETDMKTALQDALWDLVIADYRLPQFDAPTALRTLQASGRDIPFITISGTIGEDLAVQLMKSGAHDYLMKDNLVRLVPAIRRELEECATRKARREAETQLLESSERLNLALAAAKMGVWQWDLSTNAVYWSPQCYEIYRTRTFGGDLHSFESFIHPEDLPNVKTASQRAILERAPFSIQFRIVRGDGTVGWADNLGRAGYNAYGRPTRMVGTVQDITERKLGEEELQRSRTMLKSVVSAALDAVIVVDVDGAVVLWNPAAERIFGYSVREAVGRPLHQLVAPNRLGPDFLQGFATFASSGQGEVLGRTFELTAKRKDGSEFPVELSVASLQLSSANYAVGVVRDITARKRAENDLRESEQRWQFALEGSGDGVWDWNARLGSVYCSRQLKRLLGFEETEIGDRISEYDALLHAEDRERVHRVWSEIYNEESLPATCEFRLRCKDEHYKWVLGRGQVVERDGYGSVVRAIGTLTDLTSIKEAEAERERLHAQFLQAQKMESIGRLASGIAHDINNVLTVINGHSALLLATLPLDDDARDSIQQIQSAGESAASIVSQLLTFSRKTTPSRGPLDLNEVIGRMDRTLPRLVGEKIRIQFQLAPTVPPVFADRGQIEQVLMNLVVNARDAMPAGGALTISTGLQELSGPCEICHSEIQPGEYVTLTVRDSGVGIDPEIRAHLFEPFFTTKEVGQGTGLGLSVVHGIVREHEGHVAVESELGRGSAFHIMLPVTQNRKADPPVEDRSPLGGSETILVVDDDERVLRVLVQALRVNGYRVIQAAGAAESLRLLQEEKVDLLVSDIGMPNIDGYELATRAKEAHPNLRLLLISGHSERPPAEQGEIPFLPKPFTPRDLARKVREVLGTPRRSGRILVVDDQPGIRSLLRSLLEPHGYEVSEASDGKAACRMVQLSEPDLMITDLAMPGQEGIETITAVRRDHPRVRILAISGLEGGRYLTFAKHLGANDILAKPIPPDVLLDKVLRLIRT